MTVNVVDATSRLHMFVHVVVADVADDAEAELKEKDKCEVRSGKGYPRAAGLNGPRTCVSLTLCVPITTPLGGRAGTGCPGQKCRLSLAG